MATAPPPPTPSASNLPHTMSLFHSPHLPVLPQSNSSTIPPPPPSGSTPPPPSMTTPPPPSLNTPPPPPSNYFPPQSANVRPSNLMFPPTNNANISSTLQQNMMLNPPSMNAAPTLSIPNATGGGGTNLLNLPVLPPQQKAASSTPFPVADPNIPSNQTIYINNLNDKIKTDVLKKDMHSMFKQFGTIREIVAMKSFWRRGQVWIVFSNVESATKALNGMQGFLYHGKHMRINYALSKSDIIAKEDGTFEKKSLQGGPKKPRAIREREEKQKSVFVQLQQQIIKQMQNLQQGCKGNAANAKMENGQEDPNRAAKRRAVDGSGFGGAADASVLNLFKNDAANSNAVVALPNSTLFIENIAENVSKERLEDVFSKKVGFLEIRYIQSRNVAFVNFENEMHATQAMNSLQGHSLLGSALKITYAKK